MKALIIQPDETTEVRDIERSPRALQEIVGGWLEGVGGDLSDDWCAYANEEGRLQGLPHNRVASALAKALGWPGDFLVGPVVFLGRAGSEETDVPERLIEVVVR